MAAGPSRVDAVVQHRSGSRPAGDRATTSANGWPRLVAIRFSGECPRPRESTAVRLIRPDDLLGHLGVQDRPHVSTAVVSTALAAGVSDLLRMAGELLLPSICVRHRPLAAGGWRLAQASPDEPDRDTSV